MKPNDVFEDIVEETKENISHIDIDVSKIPSRIRAGLQGHQWIQMGPRLICKSCPLPHSLNIGVHRIYLGLDENGMPKFKKVGLSQKV